jgi:hypothetical protein
VDITDLSSAYLFIKSFCRLVDDNNKAIVLISVHPTNNYETNVMRTVFIRLKLQILHFMLMALLPLNVQAQQLIFSYNDKHDGFSEHHIHVKNLATGENRVVTPTDGSAWNAVFSPDGKSIVFSSWNDNAIELINVDGTGFTQLAQHQEKDYHPVYFSDGK